MRVLVTGAGGFLGRAVVDSAIEAGHSVVALVRPEGECPQWNSPLVTIARGDLRDSQWSNCLGPVDALVHLVAGTSGDLAQDVSSTVLATERMFEALDGRQLSRVIHVSSFSVYDFDSPRIGDLISAKTTPTEPAPRGRDAYTETKLYQENMMRRTCADLGVELVILRPGVIFGEGRTWQWGSGLSLSGCDVLISPLAKFRITYVKNCADAVVCALEARDAPGTTVDIVDDDLPTHLEFRRSARRLGALTNRAVIVPWRVVEAAGVLAQMVSRWSFAGNAKLPEFLDRRRQQARWKPFRYDNSAAKELLGWEPRVKLDSALRSVVDSETSTTRP